jgi:hypothetical protein
MREEAWVVGPYLSFSHVAGDLDILLTATVQFDSDMIVPYAENIGNATVPEFVWRIGQDSKLASLNISSFAYWTRRVQPFGATLVDIDSDGKQPSQ